MSTTSAYSFSPFWGNEEPLGDKNGVNDTYTLPDNKKYIAGTLMVFLNGQMYQPDSIDQTDPNKQTFKIIGGDHLPNSDDVLHISYLKSAT